MCFYIINNCIGYLIKTHKGIKYHLMTAVLYILNLLSRQFKTIAKLHFNHNKKNNN